MDPRDRADIVLEHARARIDVVTPDEAISPMDSVTTQQIAQALVAAIDYEHDVDTAVVSSAIIQANDPARTPLPRQPDSETITHQEEMGGLIPTIRQTAITPSSVAEHLPR